MDYKFFQIMPYDNDFKCDYRECNEKAEFRIDTYKQKQLDGATYLVCKEHLSKIKEEFDIEYKKIEEYLIFLKKQEEELRAKKREIFYK